jgi:hypothetical protein
VCPFLSVPAFANRKSRFEPTRRRRGLYSSCLVSRRIGAIARPLLYESITLIDTADLVHLLRTLIRHRDYCALTKSLAVPLTLTDPAIYNVVWKAGGEIVTDLEKDPLPTNPESAVKMMYEKRNTPTNSRFRSQVPQAIMFVFLTLMPNLETLLLQLPLTAFGYDRHLDYTFLMESTSLYKVKTQDGTSSGPPLGRLRTLHLQMDAEVLSDLEEDAKNHDEALEVSQLRHCRKHLVALHVANNFTASAGGL